MATVALAPAVDTAVTFAAGAPAAKPGGTSGDVFLARREPVAIVARPPLDDGGTDTA